MSRLGLRETLRPGDEIIDREGNNVITHDAADIFSVAASTNHGDFLRAARGEISVEEWGGRVLRHQAIQAAYIFGKDLPEGAAVIHSEVQ